MPAGRGEGGGMEETRLAEIEERLGQDYSGFQNSHGIYWETAARELLAEVRRLQSLPPPQPGERGPDEETR
jgi:hypothetical protein